MLILRFFPGFYTVYSRTPTVKEFLSWLYVFPFFGLFVNKIFSDSVSYSVYCLVFFLTLSLYEVGYLFNDLKTTKYEIEPTNRVGSLWYHKNLNRMICSRLFFSAVFLFFLSYIAGNYFDLILINAFLILLCFYLHNAVRGVINVFTFSLLSFVKYSSLLIFVDVIHIYILVFFSFTFLRTIEYSAIKRYFVAGRDLVCLNLDRFRFCYYLVLVSMLSVSVFLLRLPFYYVLIPGYFLAYRFVIFSLSRFVSIR